jgi:hypothetical protein
MNGYEYMTTVKLIIPGKAGGNTGTSFTWEVQEKIRYARILAIEVIPRSAMAVTAPDNIQVVSDADLSKIQFSLETNDPDDITKAKGRDGRFQGTLQSLQYVPCTIFNRLQNGTTTTASFVRQLVPFKDTYILWEKSNIFISPNGLGNTTDLAFVLNVHYSWLDEKGKPITRT